MRLDQQGLEGIRTSWGLNSQEALPATLQARELTQEEIDAALEDVRAKGLTCDGWKIEWNASKMDISRQ